MKDHDLNTVLTTRLLYALNHPIRLRILQSLARENASASALANAYGMKLGNVAYHLCKVLYEECDVVRIVETHARRGATEKVFALNRQAYVGVIQWQTIPEPIRSGVRGIALNSFLATAIAALEAESDEPRAENMYAWQPVAVNDEGLREINKAIVELEEKVKDAELKSAAADPAELTRLIVGMTAFEAAPLQG